VVDTKMTNRKQLNTFSRLGSLLENVT